MPKRLQNRIGENVRNVFSYKKTQVVEVRGGRAWQQSQWKNGVRNGSRFQILSL